jgi:tripartite-type tricarboxylate transporter receptor subunit TctC
MFQQLAGVELLHVPYKSNPLAINDLLGGQIDMMITDTATGLPQVKGGKVRALAVSTPSARRSRRPADHRRGGRARLRHGLLVRGVRAREHAAAVVNKLHDILSRRPRAPQMQQFYTTTGTDPFTTTPAELGKFQLAESDKWKSIIKKAGIEPE